MKKPIETDLVRAVLQLLSLHKIPCWRANAGGGLRRGRPIKGNPEGTPDILAILPRPVPGRLLGVECKMPGGRLRAAQVAWAENAKAAGAWHLVVTDVKQLEAALKAAKVIGVLI